MPPLLLIEWLAHVTIREVARQAKVSVGTYPTCWAGWHRCGPSCGGASKMSCARWTIHPNQIARSLKTRQRRRWDGHLGYHESVLPTGGAGCGRRGNPAGYLLITLNTDDSTERERRALSLLRAQKVDGLLLTVASGREDLTHVAQFRDSGLPIVCIDRSVPEIDLDLVSADNVHGRGCACSTCCHEGTGGSAFWGLAGLQTAQQRLDGYEQTLRDAGQKVDPKLVRHGDFRLESGYRFPSRCCSKPTRRRRCSPPTR